MKSILFSGLFLLSLIGLVYCKTLPAGHKTNAPTNPDNSRTSLDWNGVYRGILPCADCEGIQTIISLNKDYSFNIKTKYLGKSDSVLEQSGKFSWNKQGNTITLSDISTREQPTGYFVGENTLTQLDSKGNRITGELANKYILMKSNDAILEKYWKLTELNGKPVIVDSTIRKEPHIIFKEKDNRIIGNGGCNHISGTYELKSGDRITISKVISTRMACLGMDLETQFLQVLEMADNYIVKGDSLVLNRARMASLARFKAVYLK